MILALLAPCSTIWATGKPVVILYKNKNVSIIYCYIILLLFIILYKYLIIFYQLIQVWQTFLDAFMVDVIVTKEYEKAKKNGLRKSAGLQDYNFCFSLSFCVSQRGGEAEG